MLLLSPVKNWITSLPVHPVMHTHHLSIMLSYKILEYAKFISSHLFLGSLDFLVLRQ